MYARHLKLGLMQSFTFDVVNLFVLMLNVENCAEGLKLFTMFTIFDMFGWVFLKGDRKGKYGHEGNRLTMN